MKKYLIVKLYAEGYERITGIKKDENEDSVFVHFIEYDEYIIRDIDLQKRSVGDTLTGNLSIDLVCDARQCELPLIYRQPIPESSHIEVVIQVQKIVDCFSIYARSAIIDEAILVEFESRINYRVGDIIFVKGSLEFM